MKMATRVKSNAARFNTDARLNRINIEVKSSFINKSGTLITKRKNIINVKSSQEFLPQIMMQK